MEQGAGAGRERGVDSRIVSYIILCQNPLPFRQGHPIQTIPFLQARLRLDHNTPAVGGWG